MASNAILPKLLSSSVAIANSAGKIIRDILKKGDLGIVEKEHAKDLQTEADRTAQKHIISSLAAHFPGLTIIGEEDEEGQGPVLAQSEVPDLTVKSPAAFSSIPLDQFVVWVDPLDGTAEYTQGLLDHVTVLIGIAAQGKAIAGVVHQPYFNYQTKGAELGRTIYGVVGSGPDAPVVGGISPKAPPVGGRVVTTTRSHSSKTVNDAVEACSPSEVLRVGGSGHKVLLLLDGHAHAYVFASPGTKKWDTCAPQAVLEAAGGRLTDIKGADIPYGKDAPVRNSIGVLAVAPGQSHEAYVKYIPSDVKNNLKA